ncbi:MAG TPA: ATP-binding cassette domain-containing protein [Candidatus Omnitrophota bacterium]|nr:ATP-binding cassette domain-containing protein [Candidatus Omnitrophota bacterium]HPS19367.1 ATP-binding cassette domain-containing protein [Candidatus Omnitrophota bacterium]
MIEISDLSKSYANQLLFEKATFTILPGERIGLVGRNGHGKSTLFRIIIGEETPDEGKISLPKNYRIGHLRQILNFTENTVLGETAKGLQANLEDEVWRAKKILMGLGFQETDLERSPKVFSGGYQMRIELAKVLVSEPDMLLLDEPTNFLDIVSIRWLEKFLKGWKGELIIISHDRNFMDSIVTHVVGINRTKINKVEGRTEKYYSYIEDAEVIHEKHRLNEEKKRKQIEDYVTTFRAKARRAKSVQSSIKMLDKMEKIQKLDNIKTLSFSFVSAPFKAPVVMEAKGISFSYAGGRPYLINNFNLVVERGEKVCIAGANGKGKTTLAKILSGVIKPLEGEIKYSPQMIMAYYEQGNTAKLDPTMTIEDEILSASPELQKTEVRNICGAMMFSGDNALKKISVLSGGERSRVLLGKTILSPSNLLILDEPTHHLDVESCSALFQAVKEYDGATIVVTHDEFFLHQVATKLIIFRDDRIIVFPGNYSEFLAQMGWNDSSPMQKEPYAEKQKKEEKFQSAANRKEERKIRAEIRAARQVKIGPLETKVKNLENMIADAEKEHTTLAESLIKSSEQQDASEIAVLSKKYNAIKVQVDHLYEELDRAIAALEKAKREMGEDV